MDIMKAKQYALFFVAAFALTGCSGQAGTEPGDTAAGEDNAPKVQAGSSDGRSDLYLDGPKRSGALEIDATNVAYLYHRMSGEPASIDRMMTEPLKLRFDDEFARRRFLEENFDEFAKLVDEAVSAKVYTVTLSGGLEGYDFDREGFPIDGLYDRTMVTFSADASGSEGLDFALALEGTDELDILPMPVEDAERRSNSLSNSAVDLEVAFTPLEAGWEKVRDDQRRTVVGKAYSVKVLSPDGSVIGTIGLDSEPPTRPLRVFAENPFKKSMLINPWTAENAPEAVLDRYAWIIDERWKMPSYQEGDNIEEAMTTNVSAAGGCVAQYGYSECQRLAQRRNDFITHCTRSVPDNRKQECYSIRSLPYTDQEANAL
tara:strand:- start:238 stop:1356 length:1119 start_codon:yes stop_codon:yes gene_type:complete